VDPLDIEGFKKKSRLTKEERLASIHEGREGRDKFGRPKEKGGGTIFTSQHHVRIMQKQRKKMKKHSLKQHQTFSCYRDHQRVQDSQQAFHAYERHPESAEEAANVHPWQEQGSHAQHTYVQALYYTQANVNLHSLTHRPRRRTSRTSRVKRRTSGRARSRIKINFLCCTKQSFLHLFACIFLHARHANY
jgi:hypothetical protein